MPFGKYRGWPLGAIPYDYLERLTTIDLCPSLRTAVVEELFFRRLAQDSRRGYEAAAKGGVLRVPGHLREPVADSVRRGYRACAMLAHPDQGGTDAAMRMLLEARQWLEEHCRGS